MKFVVDSLQWLSYLVQRTSLNLLQNGENGLILEKASWSFYVGAFHYPLNISCFFDLIVPEVCFFCCVIINPFPVSVSGIKRNEHLYQTSHVFMPWFWSKEKILSRLILILGFVPVSIVFNIRNSRVYFCTWNNPVKFGQSYLELYCWNQTLFPLISTENFIYKLCISIIFIPWF